MKTFSNSVILNTYSNWVCLNEALGIGTLVMTLGRFNPPTIGHQWLFKQMASMAAKEKGTALAFTTHTQDKKRNPLSYDRKCHWIRKILPRGVRLVTTNARNMQEILKEVSEKNFNRLILLVGDDRKEAFSWIDKYKHDFNINKVEIVSAGARSGSSALQNASATKMRQSVIDGDFEAFKEISPFNAKDTEALYAELQPILKK